MMADPLSDDNESTRGVTSQELGDRRTRGLIAEGVHSMIVARVEKYYPATQRVDEVFNSRIDRLRLRHLRLLRQMKPRQPQVSQLSQLSQY